MLHTLFLAAPDFLGVDSVIPLADTHKDVVVLALRLKRLAYNLAEALAGRKTHPLSCQVGGFAKLPDLNELKALRKRLVDAYADLDIVLGLFKTLKIPDFVRETEYIALRDPKNMPLLAVKLRLRMRRLFLSMIILVSPMNFVYRNLLPNIRRINVMPIWSGRYPGLILISNNFTPRAKKVAKELGISAPCHNPYMITVAAISGDLSCPR